jgi:hypothetical protein
LAQRKDLSEYILWYSLTVFFNQYGYSPQ